jgi:hypothetical protein
MPRSRREPALIACTRAANRRYSSLGGFGSLDESVDCSEKTVVSLLHLLPGKIPVSLQQEIAKEFLWIPFHSEDPSGSLIHGHMLVLINTRSLKSQPFKFTKVVSVSWVEIDWGLWRAYRTGVAVLWPLCAMHRTPQDIGLLGTMEGQSPRPRELSK